MREIRISCVSFILLFHFVLLQSCAHQDSKDWNTPKEIWELELSGDTRGSMKMSLERSWIEGNIFRVAGGFSGMGYDYVGGPGEIACKFNGRVENGNLDCEFSGWGDMEETLFLRGRFTGALSEMEGSGEWTLSHTRGSSVGKWTMRRASRDR